MDTTSCEEGRAELQHWARLVSPTGFPHSPWQESLDCVFAAVATARYRFDEEGLKGLHELKIIE